MLLSSCIPLPALAQSPGAGIGAVEAARGSAQAQQGEVVRSLRAADAVLFQDRLTTGDEARLAVTLDDDSRLTLGANASLVVDRFVYDPAGARKSGQLAVNVLRGAFLFVGGRVEDRTGARVIIKTSAATLGVRGTTVWGGPIDGSFGVFVLAGRVRVSTARGAVTLTRGQGTLVNGAGQLDRPVTWGQPRIDRAFAQVAMGPPGSGFGRPGLPTPGLAPSRGPAPGAPALGPTPSPSTPAPAGGGVPGAGPPAGNGPGSGAGPSGQGNTRGN